MARNYYSVLGVSESATPDEIKKAFRVKALKAHPDVNPAPNAQAEFVELNEAYAILGDPGKRAVYNRRLLAAKAPKPSGPPSKNGLSVPEADRKAQEAYQEWVKRAQDRARQQAKMNYEAYRNSRFGKAEARMFGAAQIFLLLFSVALSLFIVSLPFFLAIFFNWKFILLGLMTVPMGAKLVGMIWDGAKEIWES